MLTTVGLLLIRLVLAVAETVTSQAVVDTVAVSTFKLIHAVAGCVLRWETERYAFILCSTFQRKLMEHVRNRAGLYFIH